MLSGKHQSIRSDLFQVFCKYDIKVQGSIVRESEKSYQIFDTHSIVKSTEAVLTSFGISADRLISFQVSIGGQDDKQNWNLKDQLSNAFKKTINLKEHPDSYIFFALPTIVSFRDIHKKIHHEDHSVGVVICMRTKRIFCMDPYGTSDYKVGGPHNDILNNTYKQAMERLHSLLELEEFKNFQFIEPQGRQQYDSFTCGIHSAANITGVILGEEVRFQALSQHPSDLLKKTVIKIETKSGIFQSSKSPFIRLPNRSAEEIRQIRAIFVSGLKQLGREQSVFYKKLVKDASKWNFLEKILKIFIDQLKETEKDEYNLNFLLDQSTFLYDLVKSNQEKIKILNQKIQEGIGIHKEEIPSLTVFFNMVQVQQNPSFHPLLKSLFLQVQKSEIPKEVDRDQLKDFIQLLSIEDLSKEEQKIKVGERSSSSPALPGKLKPS